MALNTILIPINSNNPKWSERLTIDGSDYIFHFRWNNRMSRWILSIGDQSDNPLIIGIVCCVRMDLLAQFRYMDVPQGVLMFFNPNTPDTDPSYEDFGNGAFLAYTTGS